MHCLSPGQWYHPRRAAGRTSRGFTLLEIMVGILILLLIAGVFTGLTLEFNQDYTLQDTAIVLEGFSRKASRSASAQAREWWMVFEKRRFALVEPPAAGPGDSSGPSRSAAFHELPRDVEMRLRRWNSQIWVEPERELWIFTAAGLCEPISVRFTKGTSYYEMRFNPLTGMAERTESYLP